MNALMSWQNGQEVQVIDRHHFHHLQHFDDQPSSECEAYIGELIENTDWMRTTKKLLAYARFRLSRYGASGGRFGNKAEDYAQEAVALFMDGTRRFPCGSGKTLFGFLCSVVDSLVSHDAEKARRRGPQMFIGNEQGDDAELDELAEGQLPAFDDFEERIVAANELSRFLESLEEDLAEYVRLRASVEHMTAEECAAALNTTVGAIRNMDKRLRRRRQQWNCM